MTNNERKLKVAEILEQESEDIRELDSTQGTVWSEFFHEARMAKDNYHRQERAVALIDVDVETGELDISVSKLQKGTHYRDVSADATLRLNSPTFSTVSDFTQHISRSLKRIAKGKKEQIIERRNSIRRSS